MPAATLLRLAATATTRRPAFSPVACRRFKSTHHHTPRAAPRRKTVLPKPTQPSSSLPLEEQQIHQGPPQPPVTPGPPRLVRYEPLSLYPRSSAHPSYPDHTTYKAQLSSRRAPASLFGLFPSTTVTAASASASASTLPTTMADAKTTALADNGAAHKRKAAHSHSHHHHHGHGHGHDHSHGSAEEADALLAALRGKGDRGSRITLIGLASNIGLCGAKGVAGVYLNSAALLADAAHSLSDMFSDLVTLFCWKMSQKPPSPSHPLGYGKYETMGSLGVSLVLVAGAVGIGFHSYGLLLEALQPTLQHAPAAIQAFGSFTGSLAHVAHDHGHSHGSGGPLDPNAMWFALLSVVVKEWLYHATLKIARSENSAVLEANALHHRSDSLSSGVTFLAIGGSWLGFPVLDPLGGLLVAGLIGKQGADLLIAALGELSDRGVEPEVLRAFDDAIAEVKQEKFPELLKGWRDLRAVKSGVSTFADVTLELPGDTSLHKAAEVEESVRQAIVDALKGVSIPSLP